MMINGKKNRDYWDGKYQVREFSKYIVAHQGICHGQLTFKGTRVLVRLVLESLARPGRTILMRTSLPSPCRISGRKWHPWFK